MVFVLLQKNEIFVNPHTPTSDDLAGFWDLVLIQVKNIQSELLKLNKLKENNWKENASPLHFNPIRSKKNLNFLHRKEE